MERGIKAMKGKTKIRKDSQIKTSGRRERKKQQSKEGQMGK